MNGTCFRDPIGFIKFSISPEFVPLLMNEELLQKIFVSLRWMKQELYAKSFEVNDIRENLPSHVENARRKPYPGYQGFLSRAAGIFGVGRRPTHLRRSHERRSGSL